MSAKKGLVIQAFRHNSSMDSTEAKNTLLALGEAVDEIYNRNASALSYEEYYRKAYNMVLKKHGDLLYDGIKQILSKHLRKSASLIADAPNENFLTTLVHQWSAHDVAFGIVKNVLLYVDRSYCPDRRKPFIYDLALSLFRDEIVYHPNIRDRVHKLVLQLIEEERKGFVIDRATAKETLNMLRAMGKSSSLPSPSNNLSSSSSSASSSNPSSSSSSSLNTVYEDDFENFFLAETEKFYQVESLDYLAQNSCNDYMLKVEGRIAEELARVGNYLLASTESKLVAVLDRELINAHAKTLLEMESSGLIPMLRDHKLDHLTRMYNLFNRIPSCLDMMRDVVGKYVVQSGLDILANQDANKDPVSFVKAVLDLKDKFDEINQKCFRSDKKSTKKLKDSFESFVNRDSRCAAHLASFIDELLKNGVEGHSEVEIEVKFEKVIVIFRYITDKDVFENYYKNLLCKRLLGSKSISDENERNMIAKLKAECGYQFTSKLEGMFNDMNISNNVMKEFKKSPQCLTSPVEMEVQLLTMGFWPLQAGGPCSLPPLLTECCVRFENFYLERNGGKKVVWLSQLGSVDVRANFPSGKKDLTVSTYQACLLMLFNNKETLSLDELRQATNIQEVELRRHLLSLCTPKLRILCKASKGKGIENDDQFTFNPEFTSKLKRMKVPLVSAKEVSVSEEASAGDVLPSAVDEDRRHLIEAAIVRIMKARRTLSHNDLIAEVTKQLSNRFSPVPQTIKKRIESLIEREYIQRDKDDNRLYQYLA